jgi:hypothetical protein
MRISNGEQRNPERGGMQYHAAHLVPIAGRSSEVAQLQSAWACN